MEFAPGIKVKFSPVCPEYLGAHYTSDGVKPGDDGIISCIEEDGDIVVDFTRDDGTVSEGFYVLPEDLEVISD